MMLVFAVLYPVTISRVGFQYKGTILVPSQENGNTVYSGKIQGKQAHFTVSEDKSVVFQYGKKIYEPYTIKEDATAIPKNEEMAEYMMGVELRQGEDILFRIARKYGVDYAIKRDRSSDPPKFLVFFGSAAERDKNGNIIDPVEPSASTILELMNNPELKHKGKCL